MNNNVLFMKNKYEFIFGRFVLLTMLAILNYFVFEDFIKYYINDGELYIYPSLVVINIILIYLFLNVKLVYYIGIIDNNNLELMYVNYTNILGLNKNILSKDKIIIEEEKSVSIGGVSKYIKIYYGREKYILSERSFDKYEFNSVRQEIRKYASNDVKDGWSD